jgi:spore protease
MGEIDMSKYVIRTDLAVDALELTKLKKPVIEPEIESIEKIVENIKITTVTVKKEHEKLLGKRKGKYVTLQIIDATDFKNAKKIEKVLAKTICEFLKEKNIKPSDHGLIIGLGNDKSTPDALGPMVISNILVTKHLFKLAPEEVDKGFRPVSAIIPGVMGSTGIETSDIVNAIIREIKPQFLIVVDALASTSIERVNKTIQMTDTGIHPGSGVGNIRAEISEKTAKIPVIAIGVPTVLDAVTIVSDTIDYMIKYFSYELRNIDNPLQKIIPSGVVDYTKRLSDIEPLTPEERERFLGVIGNLGDREKRQLIYEVLSPVGYNLMVTPKEIDMYIEKLSEIIARSIDMALHEKVE